MIATGGGGWYALSIAAFLLTSASLGIGHFSVPRRFEWDFRERDNDGEGFVR